MRASDYDNEPCGVRLVRLINTQALDIAKREFKNDDKMCLYGTGEYWHGLNIQRIFFQEYSQNQSRSWLIIQTIRL